MALKKQMELFEEGGLMQEGGTVDEESGNEVPTGSLKKEVRDDIPAQLSEGEFVMPADVVRFHGLDKMMALRDEAKMGLQRMEDMGQMGNSEEAVIPDGVPFSMNDLDIEDEPVEMQVGGFVQPTFRPGGVQQSQFAQYQPQFTPYQMPDYTQPTMPAYTPPQQAATPMAPTGVPEFGQFVTPTYVTYVNDVGNIIQIPVGPDGQPLIPVPAGFKKQTDTPDIPDATTPPTTVAPTTVAQPQEDPTSPEDLARQQQAQQNIKERKAAAKELGYTKEANPLEGLLKFAIPGASLFMDEPEVGTIMPDGTVADGKGNTFDPRTGKQVGGKGFLGLGKGVAEEFDMEGAAIPEASIAGLRSQAGEQSIQDLLSAVPPTEEKAPTDVGVETARVTEAADTTAAQAAERRLEASKTDIESRMDELGLQGNQRKDFLNAIINQEKTSIDFKSGRAFPESYTGIMPDTTVDFTPATSIAQAQAQTGAAQRLLDEQVDRERQTGRDVLSAIRGETATDARDDDRDEPSPADLAAAQAAAGAIRESFPTRTESMQARVDVKAKDYERQGYDKSAAQSAARNKVRADDEAMNQTGDYSGKTTAVTDKYGNAVRSGSDGSVVTTGDQTPQDDGPEPDSRWCCSQMVHRGLWTQQHEFARLTVWSSKQPDWWKSGYHVWGKVLAKTFLRKKGFWTDVMQSFYDYHIRKKPYTWRTALAHVMVYPGVFICGNIWTKQPKGVTLASFKELNG